ncbi:ferredoxin reductase-like protein [Ramicandelaber brevisporus]|nr:ferredoxin reductase-like protein [Ramicandelaber brevisporus]
MSTQRHGVFTKYLASLECGASAASPVIVHGRTRRGTMRLADAAHTPVIMVGPGTGVAPMRSFVQARARLGPASSASSTSPNVLFFGCRSRSSDDYFAAEFGRYAADGRLERHTAYSRESAAKTYVQHKVASAAADMWRLIDGGAHVYVSGSSGSMPAEVRAAFAAAISTHGGMSSDAAYDYIRALEKAGRYCEECWS